MKPYVSLSLVSLLVGAASLTAQTSSGSGSYGSNKPNNNTMSSSSSASTSAQGEKLSMGDKHFITKTAEDGAAEVQLAQLAADKATSTDVRNFAQKLVTDHTAVNQELATLASNKGVTLDNKGDKKDHTYNSLSKKTGTDFDREFIDHMVSEHEKEIKTFQKVASDAKDSDVRAFASKHVADLQGHLQIAQNLKQTIVPTGRMDKNSGRSSSDTSTNSGSDTSTTSPSAANPSRDSSTPSPDNSNPDKTK